MIYIISFFIISCIFLNLSLDWTGFNTCLVLIFFISLSEFLKNLTISFNRFLNDNSLEKMFDLKIKLEKYRAELCKWSNSLKESSNETVILQLKSLYVILTWCVQKNDETNFNMTIKKLKSMKVPDEYLLGAKKFEEFIKDVENKIYDIKYDEETYQPYFILNENNVSIQKTNKN